MTTAKIPPSVPTEVDWHIHKSQLIIDNYRQLTAESHLIHNKFKHVWPNRDSSWGYEMYNVFCLASPMPLWFEMYKELCSVVRDYVNNKDPLWIQSWLNFHKYGQELEWHGHTAPYHGYVSINPANTTTVFRGYKIENEIGNIYIGPGWRQHKVKANEEFDGTRVTLGFDVINKPEKIPNNRWGLIPLL